MTHHTLAQRPWTVTNHQPLVQHEENLWSLTADLPTPMPLQRRMTLFKLQSGEIALFNAIACREEEQQRIEQLGALTWLIVPSRYHRLDLAAYKKKYPQIRVLCPRAIEKHIRSVVAIDGFLEEFPQESALTHYTLCGVKEGEPVLVSRTHHHTSLIFNDAIFNGEHVPGLRGLLYNVMKITGKPQVSRVFRWLYVDDKKLLAEHLETLAQMPQLKRIIMTHGTIIEHHISEILHDVAQDL